MKALFKHIYFCLWVLFFSSIFCKFFLSCGLVRELVIERSCVESLARIFSKIFFFLESSILHLAKCIIVQISPISYGAYILSIEPRFFLNLFTSSKNSTFIFFFSFGNFFFLEAKTFSPSICFYDFNTPKNFCRVKYE